jgi:hypothetical protein
LSKERSENHEKIIEEFHALQVVDLSQVDLDEILDIEAELERSLLHLWSSQYASVLT